MRKFDLDMGTMEQRLLTMADQAAGMVDLAHAAIKDRERDFSDDVRAREDRLNRLQCEIDQETVRMLTVYGPVAGSLRYLLACTQVAAQLERIGDQVVNICETLRLITSDPADHPVLPNLQHMAELVLEIVEDAIDAYRRRDAEKAEITRSRDDLIDALNDQIMKEVLTDELLKQFIPGVENFADAIASVLLARHLERIADQATNICKEVVYLVRGDYVRHRQAALAE